MKDLCRTCGELPQNSNVRNIFTEVLLLKLIKEFTGLWLCNEIDLPVYMCNRCHYTINEMFAFRQRCTLVQNFFNYRRSKESESTKVRNNTKTLQDDQSEIFEEDIESEKSLANGTGCDESVYDDVQDSDEEEKYKQQEDLTKHAITCSSTQDLNDENLYSEAQVYNEEIETDGKNAEQMVHSFFDKRELFNEYDSEIDKQNKLNNRQLWERKWICEICGKMFTSNTNLKQHQYTHNAVKAFKCNICDKAYHTSSELRKHEPIHSENHPYVCSFCSAKFTYASAKIRHEKIHTNDRPHKCSYCEKSFIESSSLKNHETTHTRIRKYHCDICGHWALTRNHLRVHNKTKTHKQNENEHNHRHQKKFEEFKQLDKS